MDVDSPNALKRCSSAPQINNLLSSTAVAVRPMEDGQPQPVTSAGRSNTSSNIGSGGVQHPHLQPVGLPEPMHTGPSMLNSSNSHQGPATAGSRESLPTSFSNIFAPRVRRFSASFSPLANFSNGSASPSRNGGGGGGGGGGGTGAGPRLTPRISQLRQEECADVSNSREVNHEREIHNAMQMSQSCEDLSLAAENWSFNGSSTKTMSDDLQNPLHVALPTIGSNYCSSPSPTSRGGIGLQYPTTSPSPTRKFVTRRSMSPCPLRPSPLSSSVKRKFDLEDNYGNCYSPPSKKIFASERGSSPVCQTPSPSPICPSPDSSTASFENGSNIPLCGPFPLATTTTTTTSSGRVTPKFFLSKLTGVPSPGSTPLPFGSAATSGAGSIQFGGSASSSTCSTPTGGSTNAIGSMGGGGMSNTGGGSVAMMMDCGVSSSSSSSGSDCRDTTMEVSHTGGEGSGTADGRMYEDRTMVVEEARASVPLKDELHSSSSTGPMKMACDESETSISDSQRQRRLIGGQAAMMTAASREMREQLLKSALDPDAAGSCNSNSSNSSSTSSGSSTVSTSSCTTSDSNNSANTNASSRLSSLAGSGTGGNMLDSTSSSNSSTSSSSSSSGSTIDAANSVANAATASASGALCPPLTSFPMMAIPSNLAEIAES